VFVCSEITHTHTYTGGLHLSPVTLSAFLQFNPEGKPDQL